MLADSFAAMNVSDALWEKYYDEIVRLRRADDITAEDFHLLRYSLSAHERADIAACTASCPSAVELAARAHKSGIRAY